MHTRLVLRRMTEADLALALEWAAAEGWNPGLLGERNGVPIGCASAVRYGSGFGFLASTSSRRSIAGKALALNFGGLPWTIWADRVIGLDGVVAQQDNYRRSGFRLEFRNVRQRGGGAAPQARA